MSSVVTSPINEVSSRFTHRLVEKRTVPYCFSICNTNYRLLVLHFLTHAFEPLMLYKEQLPARVAEIIEAIKTRHQVNFSTLTNNVLYRDSLLIAPPPKVWAWAPLSRHRSTK